MEIYAPNAIILNVLPAKEVPIIAFYPVQSAVVFVIQIAIVRDANKDII